MDVTPKSQHDLGGKLDPEGKVNSSWALLASSPPCFPSALSKTRCQRGAEICHERKTSAAGTSRRGSGLGSDARRLRPASRGPSPPNPRLVFGPGVSSRPQPAVWWRWSGLAGAGQLERRASNIPAAQVAPLLGSFAPAIEAEKPPWTPDLNSSACNLSFQGGPGAGWCRRDACAATGGVVSGCCKKIFAFQALPPGLRALNRVLRPIPRELWQLFDVVSVLLENGWATDRSETQIFSSRLCGSFIKNRQINKQIAAHYEHVLRFLFKRLFGVLRALNKDRAS